MKFIPLPQQLPTIRHMLDHDNALVFSDPGTGKTAATLEVIATLLGDHEIKGVLIIAPLRVASLTWPNELAKYDRFNWMSMVSLRDFAGKGAWKNGLADIYTMNPEMLPAFCSQEWGLKGKKEIPVDLVVIDELSRFKGSTGKRYKAFIPFRSFFKRHIGLTGSPAANGLMDLFGQVKLIDGGQRLGSSFTQFRERYFESDYMGWKWTLRDWAKEKIEEKIADITITQRREDWLHLPPTSVEDVRVNLPPPIRKQYKTLEKELLLQIKDKEIVALNAAALLTKLLQFTSGAIYDQEKVVSQVHDCKLKALQTLVKEIDAPILLMAHYKHEYERILNAIPGAEMFSEARLDDWNKGKIPCWVAHSKSVGYGLNLQHGSSNIVWYSLTFSRADYDQANCRLIRTGQTKPTRIWRLLVNMTVDDAVCEALREKGDAQSSLMKSLSNLKQLSKIVVCP